MQYYRSYYGISTMKVRRLPQESSHAGKKTILLAAFIVLALLLGILQSVSSAQARKTSFIEKEVLTDAVLTGMAGHNGVFGVYVKVLDTGEEWSINNVSYTAGSCYKLPLTLLVYEMASSGEISLDSYVELRREDWEEGTGVLQHAKPGVEIPIRKLAELAITESDNIAANALLRCVGKRRFLDFQRTAGAKVVPETSNISSPRDLGLFAERLLRFSEKQPELGKELMTYYLNNRYKDRLPAKLPEAVGVLNKVGTWPGPVNNVNDVALVVCANVTYVIAVMSRDVSPTVASGTRALQDVSLAVYKHISERAARAGQKQSAAYKMLASLNR